jgi:hypothetical protein
MMCLLTVREGTPVEEPDAEFPARPGRPNDRMQRAIAWLEDALQDGGAHRSKDLRQLAKDSANISFETLVRAYEFLPGHVKPYRRLGDSMWQLTPMEANEDMPQLSEVFVMESAE